MFVGFTPAISPASAKRVRAEVRRWQLHRRTPASVQDLAQVLNPVIRGWIQYYGVFNRAALVPLLRHLDWHLVKWVKTKYRKRGGSWRRARRWLGQVARHQPALFAHWRLVCPSAAE
jgi:RNA-directed DNA polymerase